MGQKKKTKSAKHKNGNKSVQITGQGPQPSSQNNSERNDVVTPTNVESNSGLDQVYAYKDQGNAAMNRKDCSKAVEAYNKGLDLLASIGQREELLPLENALYSNRSLAYLKLDDYDRAEEDCNKVLRNDQTNAKVWYRRGLAREAKAKHLASNISSSSIQKLQLSNGASSTQGGSIKNGRTDSCVSNTNMLETMVDPDDGNLQQDNLFMAAESDLVKGLNVLENSSADDGQKRSMRKEIKAAITRIQKFIFRQRRSDHGVDLPAPMEQQTAIMMLLSNRQGCMQQQTRDAALEGEAFFLIEWKWWSHWCAYVGLLPGSDMAKTMLSYLPPGAHMPEQLREADDDSDEESEMLPPGVIDNSRLILQLPDTITNKTSSKDVFLADWYRPNQQPESDLQYNKENHDGDESPVESVTHTSLAPNLVRGYHFEVLPREVYAALSSWYGEATPRICRRSLPGKTPENNRKLCLRLNRECNLENVSVGGIRSHVGHCAACGSLRATSRCVRCLTARYCNRLCQESHWPFHKYECKELSTPAISPPAKVLVGLNNLGNTCFMNAALQCLSKATPLTRFFLSGRFKEDINPHNPLGTGGKLANAYGVTMKDLWWSRGSSSISPTALKRAIALFAPRFAGCVQHDAQEFLAYLLDGLHEDLNRIRKAPYVEMPDVSDSQDMDVAGAKAWDAHCQRNDSIVFDTFYGQFKSTCVCPQCSRVSVSFDCFNHISLELPQTKTPHVPISVMLFPQSGAKPVVYAVEVRRNGVVSELRLALSEISGIAAERLLICEIFDASIYQILKPGRPISDIPPDIAAYEIKAFSEGHYHVLASHKRMVVQDVDIEKQDVRSEAEPFGFPFITSLPAAWTCHEAWTFLWRRVSCFVIEDDTLDENLKEILKIRLHNGRGETLSVFPTMKEGVTTGYLPEYSDETLASILGTEATEQFLLLSFEWTDRVGKALEGGGGVGFVNEDRFTEFDHHPTYHEVAQRAKASAVAITSVTLDQCFDAFTRPERLDQHNKWYCSNCKEHVQAMKTMELWRLPNILIIHLKRFEFKNIFRRDKLDTFVQFPLEGLDMNRHCDSRGNGDNFVVNEVPAIYDLFAVTNHYGRLGSGHYTAYARSWNDTSGLCSEWALFDDSIVRPVRNAQDVVVSPSAYVLFYRRRVFN